MVPIPLIIAAVAYLDYRRRSRRSMGDSSSNDLPSVAYPGSELERTPSVEKPRTPRRIVVTTGYRVPQAVIKSPTTITAEYIEAQMREAERAVNARAREIAAEQNRLKALQSAAQQRAYEESAKLLQLPVVPVIPSPVHIPQPTTVTPEQQYPYGLPVPESARKPSLDQPEEYEKRMLEEGRRLLMAAKKETSASASIPMESTIRNMAVGYINSQLDYMGALLSDQAKKKIAEETYNDIRELFTTPGFPLANIEWEVKNRALSRIGLAIAARPVDIVKPAYAAWEGFKSGIKSSALDVGARYAENEIRKELSEARDERFGISIGRSDVDRIAKRAGEIIRSGGGEGSVRSYVAGESSKILFTQVLKKFGSTVFDDDERTAIVGNISGYAAQIAPSLSRQELSPAIESYGKEKIADAVMSKASKGLLKEEDLAGMLKLGIKSEPKPKALGESVMGLAKIKMQQSVQAQIERETSEAQYNEGWVPDPSGKKRQIRIDTNNEDALKKWRRSRAEQLVAKYESDLRKKESASREAIAQSPAAKIAAELIAGSLNAPRMSEIPSNEMIARYGYKGDLTTDSAMRMARDFYERLMAKGGEGAKTPLGAAVKQAVLKDIFDNVWTIAKEVGLATDTGISRQSERIESLRRFGSLLDAITEQATTKTIPNYIASLKPEERNRLINEMAVDQIGKYKLSIGAPALPVTTRAAYTIDGIDDIASMEFGSRRKRLS